MPVPLIDVETPTEPALLRLLGVHPRVRLVEGLAEPPTLVFHQGGRSREVRVADPQCALGGLVELVDNNPMVCADRFSVPSPGVTLALIAVGPLARAGIVLEPPALLANVPIDAAELERSLGDLGWGGGALVDQASLPLDGAAALTAIAPIQPVSDQELESLFNEAFGRSLYVRRDDGSAWDASLVAGRAHAAYRYGRDAEAGLATIHVLSDPDGKCGAAQMVHAMNVMAGFEESLGLA